MTLRRIADAAQPFADITHCKRAASFPFPTVAWIQSAYAAHTFSSQIDKILESAFLTPSCSGIAVNVLLQQSESVPAQGTRFARYL
ncbi:hypothetical protein [Bradyrhizobium diversitatis]|uniref:Uncharacterized protein n=1 Tax=Bradyrhizobium diversitatis TaxID=2755406 RepID=A0ABS0P6D4_9BRAD|nr:hypothetical protein [Bradyrhizobium diversitatis]MBH5388814.1 hypothetical protein [Bradyrhizobium diversitatis]